MLEPQFSKDILRLASKDSICLSASSLWRSIPICPPRKIIFYEGLLTGEEESYIQDLANLGSGIEHDYVEPKDRWYQYGQNEDLSFCFDVVDLKISRFSADARNLAVWYGATSQDASKAEVIYHLRRQAKLELSMAEKENAVIFERAFCKAEVELVSALDVRGEAQSPDSFLRENDPPYPFCNALGRESKDRGFDGIVSLSVRLPVDENWAVFSKNAVKSSVVKAYWDARITKEDVVFVCGEKWE
ncbi:MAG: RES family NAD+ phosphorylase [Oligoflexus sp.]